MEVVMKKINSLDVMCVSIMMFFVSTAAVVNGFYFWLLT